jgi:hypothetical protein
VKSAAARPRTQSRSRRASARSNSVRRWLAGGGAKGGTTYGGTDEVGFRAAENRVTVHDLHATILHLLGINHERLTFRFNGRDFRLTDVSGTVIRDVVA